MSNDPKKVARLYEEYLRDNLKHSTKEELMEQFISTVMKAMDFADPEVYQQVVKILLRYEHRKSERMIEEEKTQLHRGDDEVTPESSSGEELDFTSMYKPNNFEDLLDHLSLLRVSHSEVIEIEDMLNLVSVIKSIRPYMFEVEVPWVGTIDSTLCVAWSKDEFTNVIVAFLHGQIQLELTHKEEYSEFLLTDDGELEPYNLDELLHEIHDIQY